jgi:site-specific DNA recombinase
MIVALYARVSTTKQAEKDLSIPDQLKQMNEWCRRNGHTVAMEYVEKGASATDDKRPVFQDMISDSCVSPSPYEAIIVHSLSRFFRDSLEFGLYERMLNRKDVKLISITQQTSDDPSGEMARKIFSIFDEYQSKENGKHTLRAMKENARRGFFNGASPLYGYKLIEIEEKGNKGKKKKLSIDPVEAEIVKKIFSMYISQGNITGIKSIAAHFNEKNILRRGVKWSTTHIYEMINNRAYIGEYYFNRKNTKTRRNKPESEWIKIDLEPIIDEETFIIAQKARESRSPLSGMPARVVNGPTLLTGLLKCDICGASMTIATGKGGSYRYYKCTNKIKHGIRECSSLNIPMEKLDKAILNSLSEKIFTPERVESILKALKRKKRSSKIPYDDKLNQLNKELEEINNKSERLLEAVENGFLPMDASLRDRSQKLKARREEILIQIAGIKREKEVPLSKIGMKTIKEFCSVLKERLKTQSTDFGKGYLRLLVDEIRVKGKNVLIKGKNSAIAEALMQKKVSTFNMEVPTSVYVWLPSTDSNRGPSG